MNTFLLIPIACCVAMAATLALFGFFFPASHRPWWHALDRAEAQPASTAPSLEAVETTDRRGTALPFVGRDRRRAAQAAEARRRDGTGG
jgi:hypothetical protein